MKEHVQMKTVPDAGSNDHPGKLFRVESPWRRCLVCERRFTPEDARKHAGAFCTPIRIVH
jgi:hypothetical protein